ncbi:hypothetical protein [Nocardia jiangxiensis]|uniref:hypothetical protein n=1 Tax=Nocardia jiangxiensis TaxID=282685 RepID=UPI00146D6988|nr:hypothetical protein [Nocardia jiangxiensis]
MNLLWSAYYAGYVDGEIRGDDIYGTPLWDVEDEFANWLRGKHFAGIDVTSVPPGALERMANSNARPSPELQAVIDRLKAQQ